jgi:hypothetical protein
MNSVLSTLDRLHTKAGVRLARRLAGVVVHRAPSSVLWAVTDVRGLPVAVSMRVEPSDRIRAEWSNTGSSLTLMVMTNSAVKN